MVTRVTARARTANPLQNDSRFRGHVDDFHLPTDGRFNDCVSPADVGVFGPATLTEFQGTSAGGQTTDGRYRVRPRLNGERAVPQQLNAPRFGRLEEAERCARHQAERSEQTLVVEKLAPSGCWLELFTVASLLAA